MAECEHSKAASLLPSPPPAKPLLCPELCPEPAVPRLPATAHITWASALERVPSQHLAGPWPNLAGSGLSVGSHAAGLLLRHPPVAEQGRVDQELREGMGRSQVSCFKLHIGPKPTGLPHAPPLAPSMETGQPGPRGQHEQNHSCVGSDSGLGAVILVAEKN